VRARQRRGEERRGEEIEKRRDGEHACKKKNGRKMLCD
jgi:hypothetical protein